MEPTVTISTLIRAHECPELVIGAVQGIFPEWIPKWFLEWIPKGISQKGNFFVSIFFELKKTMPGFKEFSLINPVILKKILNQYSSYQVKIKWPNDLLIKNRKVCGILQELIKFEKIVKSK